MTVKGRREEYKEQTRAAILAAATEHFSGDGFAATTIDDVAASARVSKGSVYYHFADKAVLFEAAFRAGQERLLTAVAAAAAEHRDAWDQLDAALDAYLDGTVSDATHRGLLQQAPEALGAQRCREIDEGLGIPLLQETLANLHRTGQLAPAPTTMLARIVFSALCEAAMSAGAAADPAGAKAEAMEALHGIVAGLRRSP